MGTFGDNVEGPTFFTKESPSTPAGSSALDLVSDVSSPVDMYACFARIHNSGCLRPTSQSDDSTKEPSPDGPQWTPPENSSQCNGSNSKGSRTRKAAQGSSGSDSTEPKKRQRVSASK